MKAIFKILLGVIITVSITSCFEEDDSLTPIIVDYSSEVIELPYNIYTTNVYVKLSTGEIVDFHENDEWDIAFQTGEKDHRVIINSSDLLQLANVGSISFENYTALSGEEEWLYDASSGVADSSATGIWVDTTNNTKQYSNNLYILGKESGLNFEVVQKIQFIHVDQTHYRILHGPIESSVPDTLDILKDTTYNFVGYSFQNGNVIVNFEPPKKDWDIVFKQYLSTLYTTDGIATPYSVRGVLINTHNIEVATDTSSNFEYYIPTLQDDDFTNRWDIIGWEWKDVTVDEASNTAVYKADPSKLFIIKDVDNIFYKLHFISFYNTDGVKGYPTFEYIQLN
jgi:HmuY protein